MADGAPLQQDEYSKALMGVQRSYKTQLVAEVDSAAAEGILPSAYVKGSVVEWVCLPCSTAKAGKADAVTHRVQYREDQAGRAVHQRFKCTLCDKYADYIHLAGKAPAKAREWCEAEPRLTAAATGATEGHRREQAGEEGSKASDHAREERAKASDQATEASAKASEQAG